jgi:hypothetical protein
MHATIVARKKPATLPRAWANLRQPKSS